MSEFYHPQNISSYFRLPRFVDGAPPGYKQLRMFVNQRYGKISLIGSLALICAQPLVEHFRYRLFSKRQRSTGRHQHQHHQQRHNHNGILLRLHTLFRHSQVFRIIMLWSTLSFIMCYIDTYNDIMIIAKRLGRISCACMPALLFITLRPSPLPRSLYLSLLPLHKWLSRIVVLEGFLHTILYLVNYARYNTFFKIYKPANMLGVVAMAAFGLIAITSLPKVRRSNFKIFYLAHYIMTWVSVIALQYHARPGITSYTVLNCIILSYQILYRILKTKKSKVSVVPISPTLALLEFPTAALANKPILPCGHVRINNKNVFLKDLFYQIVPLAHPFTMASLPNESNVKLIIRRGNFPLLSNREYYITGTFEPRIDFIQEPTVFQKLFETGNNYNPSSNGLLQDFNSPLKYKINASKVLIVVGGSGISFGIPMMRILNYNGISCRLLWVCKDIKDLNLLNSFKGVQGIECYITGDVKEDDIRIDYYEDGLTENSLQKVDYETNDGDEESEIDFTTLGRSYRQAHKIESSSTPHYGSMESSPLQYQPSKSTLNDHENLNIDISGTCNYSDFLGSPTSTNRMQNTIRSVLPDEIDAEAFKSIKVPKSVNIYYGRPNLNSSHYDWCVESECIGPTITQNGQAVCCRDLGEDGIHQHVDKSKIWVLAAGPAGLVDHAQRWAEDGGLQCHIESFAV